MTGAQTNGGVVLNEDRRRDFEPDRRDQTGNEIYLEETCIEFHNMANK